MKQSIYYGLVSIFLVQTALPLSMQKPRAQTDSKPAQSSKPMSSQDYYAPPVYQPYTPQTYTPSVQQAAVATASKAETSTTQAAVAAEAVQQETRATSPAKEQEAPSQNTALAGPKPFSSEYESYTSPRDDNAILQQYISAAAQQIAAQNERQRVLTKQLGVPGTAEARKELIAKEFVPLVKELAPLYQDLATQTDEFTNLLIIDKALAHEQEYYLKAKKELAGSQEIVGNPTHGELNARLHYTKNELVGAKIKTLRAMDQTLIERGSDSFLKSQEGKGTAFPFPSQETIVELGKKGETAFQNLDNLKEEKVKLQGRINSWFYWVNPWELSRKELAKLADENDRKIEEQTKDLKDTLTREFLAKKILEEAEEKKKAALLENKKPESLSSLGNPGGTPPESPRSPGSPKGPRGDNGRLCVIPANLAELFQEPLQLDVSDVGGDNIFFKIIISLYELLEKLISLGKNAQQISAHEFENLLLSQYELLQKQSECLKRKAELSALENEYQKTKDLDLKADHWYYERNEKKLVQIEAALASVQILIGTYSNGFLNSPDSKELVKQTSFNADNLQKKIAETNRNALKAYQELEKFRTEQSQLSNRAKGLVTSFNFFGSRDKLRKDAQVYDARIANQRKILNEQVKEKFIAEQLASRAANKNRLYKAAAALGATVAGAATVALLPQKTAPRDIDAELSKIWPLRTTPIQLSYGPPTGPVKVLATHPLIAAPYLVMAVSDVVYTAAAAFAGVIIAKESYECAAEYLKQRATSDTRSENNDSHDNAQQTQEQNVQLAGAQHNPSTGARKPEAPMAATAAAPALPTHAPVKTTSKTIPAITGPLPDTSVAGGVTAGPTTSATTVGIAVPTSATTNATGKAKSTTSTDIAAGAATTTVTVGAPTVASGSLVGALAAGIPIFAPPVAALLEPDDATARHQAFQEFSPPGDIDYTWEAEQLQKQSSAAMTASNKAQQYAEYVAQHPEKYSAPKIAQAAQQFAVANQAFANALQVERETKATWKAEGEARGTARSIILEDDVKNNPQEYSTPEKSNLRWNQLMQQELQEGDAATRARAERIKQSNHAAQTQAASIAHGPTPAQAQQSANHIAKMQARDKKRAERIALREANKVSNKSIDEITADDASKGAATGNVLQAAAEQPAEADNVNPEVITEEAPASEQLVTKVNSAGQASEGSIAVIKNEATAGAGTVGSQENSLNLPMGDTPITVEPVPVSLKLDNQSLGAIKPKQVLGNNSLSVSKSNYYYDSGDTSDSTSSFNNQFAQAVPENIVTQKIGKEVTGKTAQETAANNIASFGSTTGNSTAAVGTHQVPHEVVIRAHEAAGNDWYESSNNIPDNYSESTTFGPQFDPEDPEEKIRNALEKLAETIKRVYEENPKHHPNARGNISPAPLFPHESLKAAIPLIIGDEIYFVSICKSGELVDIFAPHISKLKWHGYSMSPSQLLKTPVGREAFALLRRLGLVSSKGIPKFIKEAAKEWIRRSYGK